MVECIVGVDFRCKLKCMEVLEVNEFLIFSWVWVCKIFIIGFVYYKIVFVKRRYK